MKLFGGVKKYIKRAFISLYSPAVKRFLKRNAELKLVGVSGSVGKTSTKFAIAEVLRLEGKKVLVHEGAYNDPLTAIFVILGVPYPNINNPLEMLGCFFKLRKASGAKVDIDTVLLELGTDMPGEMRQFGKYLKLDACVITAITPEHMVNFKSLDDVAKEELEVLSYSKRVIVCRDLVSKDIQKKILDSGVDNVWFGTASSNEAMVRVGSLIDIGLKTKRQVLVKLGGVEIAIRSSLLHLHSGFVMAAALLVGRELGVNLNLAGVALESLSPAAGRGFLIAGKKGSVIIDDSYNNVGANVSIASLDLLYEFNTRRRIAVMGGINELSDNLEREAHTQVALHLNKKKLEEVILIGSLAKTYYKPILETTGIPFKVFNNPYKAGNYLQGKLVAGMVVLVKGSQNGIYSEEAIKPLLQSGKDEALLVRQSTEWLEKKRKCFGLE